MAGMELPRFLAVRVGDVVAVKTGGGSEAAAVDWWAGQVIHAEGGARCGANSLFQIACVDSGVIRTVNADAVIDILAPAAGAGLGSAPASAAALEPAHDHGHQSQRTGQGHQEGDRHGG
jgi:hypothetical protein